MLIHPGALLLLPSDHSVFDEQIYHRGRDRPGHFCDRGHFVGHAG